MISYFVLTAVLTAAYLALSANPAWDNVILGAVMSVGLILLLRPGHVRLRLWSLPVGGIAIIQYGFRLAIDLMISGIQVARIVLHPKLPLRSGITAVPSGTGSDIESAISAHAITLTPGELVVEMDIDGVMYTHSLNVDKTEKEAEAAQQKRLEMIRRIYQ